MGTLCFTLMVAISFLSFLSRGNCERLSGIYVDNGFDQTIVHRVITKQEKREVEHEILSLLGLPDRPKNLHRGKVPQVKRSAPKFLLDIYKNALNDESEVQKDFNVRQDEFGLSGQDLRAIGQSDVIMTFAAHSEFVLIVFNLDTKLS